MKAPSFMGKYTYPRLRRRIHCLWTSHFRNGSYATISQGSVGFDKRDGVRAAAALPAGLAESVSRRGVPVSECAFRPEWGVLAAELGAFRPEPGVLAAEPGVFRPEPGVLAAEPGVLQPRETSSPFPPDLGGFFAFDFPVDLLGVDSGGENNDASDEAAAPLYSAAAHPWGLGSPRYAPLGKMAGNPPAGGMMVRGWSPAWTGAAWPNMSGCCCRSRT